MNDLAAECYRRGRDLIFGGGAVRPDLAKGVELFMVAAEKGHVEAQVFLADRCRDGLGLKKDLGRAARIYRQAAEQGDARAQHKLGMCYQFGEGVALDAETAFCWFCKAAEQRLVDAYFELGFCYLGGFGVGQDIDEAIAWFEEAAANGHVGAQHFLGRHQPYDGKLRFPELVKTATMYVLAAQQGYAVAQRGLAHLYKHGIILQKNPDQADQWLRKANGRGYSETNHEDSLGFERDVNRAFYGFEEPGSRNDSFRRLDSNGSISKRTLNGAELENDPLSPRTLVAESTDLIDFGSDTHSTGTLVTDSFVDQREARLHHSASTLSIGETDTSFGTKAPDDQFSGDGSTAQTPYARGLSAERSGNSRQAIYWYKRALDLGFTEVEFNIGRCYHDLKELDAAAKWYRKAADRGKAGAQFCLGTIYQYGSVFEKDLLQAITWYRNAAEQGHAEAQYSLGLCYEAGEGVAKDKQEAVRFFKFAAQQGHELAKKRLATLLPGPAQPSTNPLPSTITVSVPNLPASTRPPDAAGGESSRTPSSFLGSRSLFWIEEEDISIDRTQVLGRGGFGNVYAGKHLGLTDVAVKVALEKFNTEEAAALLKAEVAAWSRLPFHEHGGSSVWSAGYRPTADVFLPLQSLLFGDSERHRLISSPSFTKAGT